MLFSDLKKTVPLLISTLHLPLSLHLPLESLSDVASSDVVLAHSTFDALRLGRSAQIIVGCLLRFGDSKNIKKQGEFMGITLLFLDEKNSVIHGFISAGHAPYYCPSLRAGSVVRVSRFEVARCTNMYKIMDHLCLSSTPATRVFFSPDLPDIKQFKLSLSGAGGEHFNWLDDSAAISNKQLCSVGDPKMFLSSSTTQPLVEVLIQNGWNYLSCIHCSKEIEQSGATLHCNRCFNSNINGVVRYSVELLVDDGNNYATAVVLNKEMLKLTKQDAATLLLNEVNSDGDGKLSQCIKELEGHTFIFHIHVSPSNSASSHRPFTVSPISGKITTEDFNNNETPYAVREFGEASTSASPRNTSTVEVEQGGRKNARE
ncbi:hypothetical protein F2Q70_00029348 [Brassica cretica]|uniref:Replication factor A C-terminal domain-containing protein n=1 Tax=Brassica cretica TaxID=69181 RepID=A0A8S9H5N4_BRACR|nr:hypothetical protein F2Q70_00029348 [Brassica cretica]KAF2551572.1 hypothetical protein F2Q68_00033723 [Brassica cretica]